MLIAKGYAKANILTIALILLILTYTYTVLMWNKIKQKKHMQEGVWLLCILKIVKIPLQVAVNLPTMLIPI